MKLLSAAILLGSLLTQPVFATGDQGGGGGAGTCTTERCEMLAEIGFRIRPELSEEINLLHSSVIKELRIIESEINRIPGVKDPRDAWSTDNRGPLEVGEVIGKKGTIEFVETVDEDKVEKYLAEYAEIIKEQNSDISIDSLSLFAFSKNKKTYVIIDKYEKQSDRSKALLLLHEHHIRDRRLSVAEALYFDGAIIDYLENKEKGTLKSHHKLNMYDALIKSKYAWKSIIGLYIYGELLSQSFNLYEKIDLAYDFYASNPSSTYQYQFNYSQHIENSQYFNESTFYIQDITEVKAEYGMYRNYYSNLNKDTGFSEYLKSLKKKERVFSSDLLNEFLLTEYPSKRDQSIIQMLENSCGDLEDESKFIYLERYNEDFIRMEIGSCDSNEFYHYGSRRTYGYAVHSFSDHDSVKGMGLNGMTGCKLKVKTDKYDRTTISCKKRK